MSELAVCPEKVQNGINHNTGQEGTATAGYDAKDLTRLRYLVFIVICRDEHFCSGAVGRLPLQLSNRQ